MEDVQSRGHHTAPLPSRYTDRYEKKVKACKVETRGEEDFQDTWGTEEDMLGYRQQDQEEDEVREEVVATTDELTDEELGDVFAEVQDSPTAADDEPERKSDAPASSIDSFVGSFRNSLRFNH